MSLTLDQLLNKYGETIKQEVNVKEIEKLDVEIQKVYKPVGSKISKKFGKDTGSIIRFAKQGNVKLINDNEIKVYDDDDNEWTVKLDDCEIDYKGLDGDDIAIDKGLVVKLDLNLTEDLKKQGILREMSRFLNQLRKKADYNVDDRINMCYFTQNDFLNQIVQDGKNFLQKEALLSDIDKKNNNDFDCDVLDQFDYNDQTVWFGLAK